MQTAEHLNQKLNFCTIFDKNYLALGLALYESLIKVESNFQLFILCMDLKTHQVLTSLNLPFLVPIPLEAVLNAQLISKKSEVTHGQFCWLLQPFFCKHLLQTKTIESIIYIDSDCYFFSSPRETFIKIKAQDFCTTLVPHNFNPDLAPYATKAGKFCVQFNFFNQTKEAQLVLEKWCQDCLNYSKERKADYPGQLSLNSWESLSSKVWSIDNPKFGVAPWNLITNLGWLEKNELPVFFHFHAFFMLSPRGVDLGHYPIPSIAIENVYKPYADHLQRICYQLEQRFPQESFIRKKIYPFSFQFLTQTTLKEKIISIIELWQRWLQGNWNIYSHFYKEIEWK